MIEVLILNLNLHTCIYVCKYGLTYWWCILGYLFSRDAPEDVEKEELPHLLGLLAQLRPPAERAGPQRGPGLPVRPAAQLRVPGGRSAQASHGEERRLSRLMNGRKEEGQMEFH